MTIHRFIKICSIVWVVLIGLGYFISINSEEFKNLSSDLGDLILIVSFPFLFAICFIALLIGIVKIIYWGFKTYSGLKPDISRGSRFWSGTRLMLSPENLTEQGKEFRLKFILSHYWILVSGVLAAPLFLVEIVFANV